MPTSPTSQQVDRLLNEAGDAFAKGAWSLAGEIAATVLDLNPTNDEARIYLDASKARARREVRLFASSLDCLPVLAFVTDRLNRIQWVNRSFADTIGDPNRDRLPPDQRFLHAAIAGPYRGSFPRWKQELSNCLTELHREVEAGHLAEGTLRLIDQTLGEEMDLRRAAENPVDWDGTMLVREPDGHLLLVQEHVLPLTDSAGHSTGLHVTQWFPTETGKSTSDKPSLPAVAECLTPRQVEIAVLFASGLTAPEVAAAAGISPKTARDHLEDIYDRLNIHSRAHLTLSLAHANLI